jgi:Tol biopolymer transport system component
MYSRFKNFNKPEPNKKKIFFLDSNLFTKCFLFFVALLFCGNIAFSQLRVVSIEKVNLPKNISSYNPKFAPDGKSIFFSNTSYAGIWRYNIDEKTTQEITTDGVTGFGFEINKAGNKIAYRKTTFEGVERKQEIIEQDLDNYSTTVLGTARNISTPVYFNEKIITSENVAELRNVQAFSEEVALLGIENTKIAILKNGKKEIIDPLEDGNYIWPSLSPDGKTILAVSVGQGAFLCTTDGNVIQRFAGRKNAPAFTHDGKWIVYMVDTDDGHEILNSDIYAVSVDGQTTIQLTSDNKINMNPAPSTTENKIAFSTLDGELFILSYEETR